MNFVTDPLSLALALGLLGPAAVDDQGLFDEGPREGTDDTEEMVGTLAALLDAPLSSEGDAVLLQDEVELEELTVDLVFEE